MTLPTGEVIDRLEQGMEDISKVEQIWNEKVVPLTNWISTTPQIRIPIVLAGAAILTLLIRKMKQRK